MPPQAIAIRPLRADDLPAALAIQAQTYPAFLVEDEVPFASRMHVAAPFCLAAVDDGGLIGYLLAHGWPCQSPPPIGAVLSRGSTSDVLFIHDLAVAPAGRGAGLGRMLVERAFALAAGQGLRSAELIAVEGAADYWRTLGFIEPSISPALAAKVAAYGSEARWMVRDIPTDLRQVDG